MSTTARSPSPTPPATGLLGRYPGRTFTGESTTASKTRPVGGLPGRDSHPPVDWPFAGHSITRTGPSHSVDSTGPMHRFPTSCTRCLSPPTPLGAFVNRPTWLSATQWSWGLLIPTFGFDFPREHQHVGESEGRRLPGG
jgi:hypothetical protein